MRLYTYLSKLSYFKTYKSKLMLVAFVGTHVPLLVLLLYLIQTVDIELTLKLKILYIATAATVVSTGVTLLAINSLLVPITRSVKALQTYWKTQKLPKLPVTYTDEVGVLMANITRTIQKIDRLLRYATNYDALTGIPNRTFFKAQLAQAMAMRSPEEQIVIFLIDIDEFKELNTVEDHVTGDQVLKAIAHRLIQYVDKPDSLARLGSDEFAFFISTRRSLDFALGIAATLQQQLKQPYTNLSPTLIQLTTSLGIAACSTDSDTPEQLIANAYSALQQAKSIGKNNYQLYSTEIAASIQNRASLVKDLRRAIEKKQLLLHYQPRVDWRDNSVVGVECLLRWQHPERGFISPSQFIPLAEETGYILPIGEWVLRTACQQRKDWQRKGLPDFTLAVNLSVRQIETPGLVDLVERVLNETQLDPQYLELEVTESLLIGEVEHTISVLEALHQKGIKLALDDFGTGYASLNYLRQFPFDILKIDRSFVKDMVHSADAAEVTRAIVALAKGLRLDLIAEGVETEEQLNQIKTYDCHEIQGYYFSRPLPAMDLSRWIDQQSIHAGKNI